MNRRNNNNKRSYEKDVDYSKVKRKFLEGIGVPEIEKFVVDPFQQSAIDAVAQGYDTLVVAPTGSGKTYIAFEAIAVAIGFKKRAVYTTPLKALSNTKYIELKKRFEPHAKVGLLTGDRKIDTDADILVATTEIYRNELYRDYGEYAVVVLDEVHYIADQQRGPVWEEAIILSPKESTLLMLSASISNAQEIVDWMYDVRERECKLIIEENRPVELRLGFLDPDKGILPLYNPERTPEELKTNPEVFKPVLDYYGRTPIDSSVKRLQGEKFSRPRNKDNFRSKNSDRKQGSRNKDRRG